MIVALSSGRSVASVIVSTGVLASGWIGEIRIRATGLAASASDKCDCVALAAVANVQKSQMQIGSALHCSLSLNHEFEALLRDEGPERRQLLNALRESFGCVLPRSWEASP
jgi:hypothetical protein